MLTRNIPSGIRHVVGLGAATLALAGAGFLAATSAQAAVPGQGAPPTPGSAVVSSESSAPAAVQPDRQVLYGPYGTRSGCLTRGYALTIANPNYYKFSCYQALPSGNHYLVEFAYF